MCCENKGTQLSVQYKGKIMALKFCTQPDITSEDVSLNSL
jgi:hypothetical protein